MIEFLPFYLPLLMGLSILLTLGFLYRASHHSGITLVVCLAWLTVQGIVSYSGFYTATNSTPPHFLLLVFPALCFILILFFTRKGRVYIDALDTRMLTYLHLVRVPVEVVLLGLYFHQMVPQLMTFEGRNFDIFSGITAPLVAFFAYRSMARNKKLLITWNLVCLGLLLNIVISAVLSAPFPFQQLAFDQPNVAVLFFPFSLLPGFIVPAVFFAHLVCLRQLFRSH